MKTFYKSLVLLMFCCIHSALSNAQNTNFNSGSFIVNMGITPQTTGNALKPYGLVYDLVRNYDVPVYWAINPNKLKDGNDFVYNGTAYKGGTFIIAVENRNATIDARITYWQTQGVIGIFSTSSFMAPIAQIINTVPRWTLDFKSGQIAQNYIINAGIPSQNTNWTEPYMLNACNDIFVLPHADPKWDYHKFLIDWNNTNKGSIWASCHAVSVLENMFNPGSPSQQANFLALNSAGPGSQALVPFGSHKDGSVPFNNNSYPTDPVMQFMGSIDQATTNGSEQIYLPAIGGGWRNSTKVCVYDPTHVDVPSLSPGKAAVIAYGKAYGDNNRGWVMYEGGHNHDKGDEGSIAAQRAFFNFSYMATLQKSMDLSVSGIQSVIVSNTLYNLSASIQQAIPSGPYTIQWTSSCGGVFSNPTSLITNFTPPLVGTLTNCVINLKVTDACSRTRFQTFNILITNGPRPPAANPDSLSFSPECINVNPAITINAKANDTEPDGQPITITSVTGSNGVWSINPDQTIRFVPSAGFYGSTTANYTICDNTTPTNLCVSSTIKITIGTTGQQPVITDDLYNILEDSIQIRLNVLSNDLPGAGGGILKLMGLNTLPLHGKVSINTDNTITYIPNADHKTTDSFYYKAVNGAGYVGVGKVQISIIADGCSPGYYQTCIPGPNPISIIASEDTYLNDKNRDNDNTNNYGSQPYLIVNREATDKYRSLVKFSLPSLTCDPAVIPVITNAVLKLYKSGGGSGLDVDAYRATAFWKQNEASWNNRVTGTGWTTSGGDFDPTLLATNNVSADGVYNWNITSTVSNWFSNPSGFPNNGILLKTTEGGGNRDPNFISTENTSALMKPTLEISYTIPLLCKLIPVRPPLSMPDTAQTNALTPISIPVLNNDYFPNAGSKTISIIAGSVSSGSANTSGSNVNYTPLLSFSGTATLQYRVVNNTTGLADTASVFIFITYAPPIAINDSATIYSGGNVSVNVTTNDIDPQNIGLTASVIG